MKLIVHQVVKFQNASETLSAFIRKLNEGSLKAVIPSEDLKKASDAMIVISQMANTMGSEEIAL